MLLCYSKSPNISSLSTFGQFILLPIANCIVFVIASNGAPTWNVCTSLLWKKKRFFFKDLDQWYNYCPRGCNFYGLKLFLARMSQVGWESGWACQVASQATSCVRIINSCSPFERGVFQPHSRSLSCRVQ